MENFVQMYLVKQSSTMIFNNLTICLTSAAVYKILIMKQLGGSGSKNCLHHKWACTFVKNRRFAHLALATFQW